MSTSKKSCFVVTPIGDNDSPIRRHIDGIIDQAITPALEEKYDIDVAHRKFEIGSINDRVIKSIYNSDLVIANLTGLNPNVMFELAIRYSFGKPAIVIAEEGTKLPFDIIEENTIFYINDPAGANDLKNKLIEFENNIDLEKKSYGPVYRAVSTVPLYKEVESGGEISNDKLLTYVIERLDSIENRIGNNIKINKKTDCEVTITLDAEERLIESDELFEKIQEIASRIQNLAHFKFSVFNDICFVIKNVNNKREAEALGLHIMDMFKAEGIKVASMTVKMI